jgi:hypothetical protein
METGRLGILMLAAVQHRFALCAFVEKLTVIAIREFNEMHGGGSRADVPFSPLSQPPRGGS